MMTVCIGLSIATITIALCYEFINRKEFVKGWRKFKENHIVKRLPNDLDY